MYLIGCQVVPKKNHPGSSICSIGAVWIERQQLSKIVERFLSQTRITFGVIHRNQASQDAAAIVEGRQSFHVIGVVDVLILRMQSDEAIRRGTGSLLVAVAEIGINNLNLRLRCEAAKRKARLKSLVGGNCTRIVPAFQLFQCSSVELLLCGQAREFVGFISVEKSAPAEEQQKGGNMQKPGRSWLCHEWLQFR